MVWFGSNKSNRVGQMVKEPSSVQTRSEHRAWRTPMPAGKPEGNPATVAWRTTAMVGNGGWQDGYHVGGDGDLSRGRRWPELRLKKAGNC